MAYKFQLGAARLSGSVIQTDGDGDLRATTVDSLNASNGGIAAAGAIAGATTVSGSGLFSAAGGLNVAEKFTVSTAGAVVAVGVNAGGAITGATTIAASSNATIEGIVSGAAGTFDALAGTSLALQSGGITAAGAIAGATTVTATGLGDFGSLTVDDDANIGCNTQADLLTISENLFTVKSDSQMAATFIGVDANNRLEFDTSNNIKIKVNGAERLRFNDTGNTIVKGDLLVEGTTTTIDSTTINVSRSFTFEGPASDFETVFGYGATDAPLQDITVILPEYSSSAGAHNVKAAVIADGGTSAQYAAAALVTAAEMAVLDGGTSATSVTIADSDQMILNDAGTLVQIAMSDVKTYAGGAAQVLEVAVVADGATLVADKLQYVADRDGAVQNVGLTLPASNNNLIGKSIYIKAGNLENSAKITVATAAGDQKIDGVNSIILESPFASVRLIYVVADQWRVF